MNTTNHTTNRRIQRLMAVVLTFVLLLGAAPASAAKDELSGADLSKLEPALQTAIRAKADGKLRVIVQRQVGKNAADKRAKEADLETDLKAEGGKVHDRLGIIDAHTVTLAAKKIAKLSQNRKVKAISLDHEVQLRPDRDAAVAGVDLDAGGERAAGLDAGQHRRRASRSRSSTPASSPAPTCRTPSSASTSRPARPTLGDLGGHGTPRGRHHRRQRQRSRAAPTRASPRARGRLGQGHDRRRARRPTRRSSRASSGSSPTRRPTTSGSPTSRSARPRSPATPTTRSTRPSRSPGSAASPSSPRPGTTGRRPATIVVPGNDPYVITVGAVDDNLTVAAGDDVVPDWTSRGPTAVRRASASRTWPPRAAGSSRCGRSARTSTGCCRTESWSAPSTSASPGTSMAAPVVSGRRRADARTPTRA